MKENFILPPDPARIMESLRDTGYDFNTAIADLVDNSISANASILKIYINTTPDNEINVYLADNGCGMDLDGLKNAMKYGSSHRDDPSSLGKYGLGLKTASTAFCRSLSLLSKTNESEYNKVCWDLDKICETNEWTLLHLPLDEDEVDILDQVTEGNSGTLVIWNKVDRLVKRFSTKQALNTALKRITAGLKQHLAMVFERFLDKDFTEASNIDIYVNDEKIEPWDPFCKREANTTKMPSIPVRADMPDGTSSTFKVEAYVLPRKDDFSSLESYSNALINNDYEGFYIYRENRLIHYGDWLKINKNDPHYSLLRINFSFDHKLDSAFNVDIKKSRISLNEDIFAYLKDQFLPAPRRAAEDLYRKGHSDSIKKAAGGAHSSSNTNIENKAEKVESADVTAIDDKKVELKNKNGTFITDKIKIVPQTTQFETRVIPVEELDANMLWEPTVVNGKLAVSINQSHPYYDKVYAPVLENSNLVTGMDSLLWSLSEAEMSTYNKDIREAYEDMRIEVSKILKRLLSDLPETEFDGE